MTGMFIRFSELPHPSTSPPHVDGKVCDWWLEVKQKQVYPPMIAGDKLPCGTRCSVYCSTSAARCHVSGPWGFPGNVTLLCDGHSTCWIFVSFHIFQVLCTSIDNHMLAHVYACTCVPACTDTCTENPSLLFCILICCFLSSHSTSLSPVMRACVCVCVYTCACMCMCVWWNEYTITSL